MARKDRQLMMDALTWSWAACVAMELLAWWWRQPCIRQSIAAHICEGGHYILYDLHLWWSLVNNDEGRDASGITWYDTYAMAALITPYDDVWRWAWRVSYDAWWQVYMGEIVEEGRGQRDGRTVGQELEQRSTTRYMRRVCDTRVNTSYNHH